MSIMAFLEVGEPVTSVFISKTKLRRWKEVGRGGTGFEAVDFFPFAFGLVVVDYNWWDCLASFASHFCVWF